MKEGEFAWTETILRIKSNRKGKKDAIRAMVIVREFAKLSISRRTMVLGREKGKPTERSESG